ncbi:iron uptake porin [Aetokthonos hydrillicola Thurmond2011]|uniref:Iron uptake porin n=1 Tax=Aetokthonos hydrillicola Thurmond2011 TaxID=2712845 RepID=A0AAP5ICA8_9CYAN|nr:iron uptake porin [Aetokthonos hydrillicola]MBO3458234.1 iron uptake porin [Aetokthonos hydrillicola CCALA 1050]MBW4584453.1 iron uptake porin [Aetokthonos hydrillicola CCALA 1050]MDR9896415.1 iron uptake porin [Aetokthonos hydrillicola Thurmond2011]
MNATAAKNSSRFFCINTVVKGVTLLSLLLLIIYPASAETTVFSRQEAESLNEPQVEESTSGMSQVTNVNQLSDVQPSDWAFQALQSLVERYGCIAGYTNGTFRGNRAVTRYEFAAGVNACLDRVNELIGTATADIVKKEDLATLQKLQEQFARELVALRGRIDTLEAHTAELEAHQFSTTTKIQGQAIISVSAGGFNGRTITIPGNPSSPGNPGNTAGPGNPGSFGNPTGTSPNRVIAFQPNPTLLFRAGVDLNTSFTGTDLLKIRLDTGSTDLSGGPSASNAPGLLEPNFGSVIDYSVKPPVNRQLILDRLYYTFQPFKDFQVTVGPNIYPTDFVDRNSYAYLSFLDFSTLAFTNNLILFPVGGLAAGAAIDWKPNNGPISVRGLYAASDAANPGRSGQINGAASFAPLLYPSFNPPNTSNTPRGLFGSTYQGMVEIEYAPSRAFAVRLQYSGGELTSNHFDVIGVNAELTLAQKFGIFGRYGYGSFNNTSFGNVKPNYWMAGVAMRDLLRRGSLAGVAVGQPFIASQIGNSTQTNFEAFYNYPFSQSIQLTPTIQVIDHAGNQQGNGTIITGTLRSVFSF